MRKVLFPILLVLLTSMTFSFTYKVDKVQWYSWEQANKLSKSEQKKIFVFIHTNNCNWCMKMENSTFNENHISAYFNENYVPVKFNAQTKETIVFKGKEYKYINQGKSGYHELAAALTGGRLVYPTSVFLTEDGKVLQSIQGYQENNIFEMIMTFYGENHHMKTPWKKYVNTYTPMKDNAKPMFIPDKE